MDFCTYIYFTYKHNSDPKKSNKQLEKLLCFLLVIYDLLYVSKKTWHFKQNTWQLKSTWHLKQTLDIWSKHLTYFQILNQNQVSEIHFWKDQVTSSGLGPIQVTGAGDQWSSVKSNDQVITPVMTTASFWIWKDYTCSDLFFNIRSQPQPKQLLIPN